MLKSGLNLMGFCGYIEGYFMQGFYVVIGVFIVYIFIM